MLDSQMIEVSIILKGISIKIPNFNGIPDVFKKKVFLNIILWSLFLSKLMFYILKMF